MTNYSLFVSEASDPKTKQPDVYEPIASKPINSLEECIEVFTENFRICVGIFEDVELDNYMRAVTNCLESGLYDVKALKITNDETHKLDTWVQIYVYLKEY